MPVRHIHKDGWHTWSRVRIYSSTYHVFLHARWLEKVADSADVLAIMGQTLWHDQSCWYLVSGMIRTLPLFAIWARVHFQRYNAWNLKCSSHRNIVYCDHHGGNEPSGPPWATAIVCIATGSDCGTAGNFHTNLHWKWDLMWPHVCGLKQAHGFPWPIQAQKAGLSIMTDHSIRC
jgi:hypothetical protein